MAQASVQLIVDAAKAVNPLRKVQQTTKKVERAVERLKSSVKKIGPAFERAKNKAVSALKKIQDRARKATASFKGFGKAAAIAAVAASAIAGLRFAFMQAGELERQTKSLQVLTGSLKTAKEIISDLQAFGAVTPFTSQELIKTAKRMKAFGFETDKVVGITKRLADIAGATGADLGGIATAFGQIQSKGRLQGEELLQLQERGVALQDELRKMYGMTGEEFSAALRKGQISAKAAEVALIRLTEKGGKYANGAIAQSDTLFGKLSTLQDALQRFGQNIGKFLSPIFKGIIDFLTTITNQINNLFQRMERAAAINKQARINLGIKEGGRPTGQQRAALRNERARLFESGFGLSAADAPKTPDLSVPKLLGGTAGGGGRGKSAADILADQMKAGAVLLQEQERTLELTRQETDLQRELLQIQYDKQDAAARIKTTTAAGQQEELLANNSLIASNRKQAAIMDYVFERTADSIGETIKLVEERQKAQSEFKAFFQNTMEEEAAKMKELYKSIGDTISTGIVDALSSAVEGTKKLSEIASDVLRNVGRILLQFGVNSLLGSIPGLGSIFGRANGGPVEGGRPYLVGERGPELFMPSQSGQVSSNEDMRRLMGRSPAGAASSMNFTFETTNIGGTEYVSREQLELAMATTRRQAANDGATRGMNMTLDRMQNSPRTRARVGIA